MGRFAHQFRVESGDDDKGGHADPGELALRCHGQAALALMRSAMVVAPRRSARPLRYSSRRQRRSRATETRTVS